MPKKRGETDQQWMARIRAARAMIEARNGDEVLQLQAFMALFHPEANPELVQGMVRDVRDSRRR
jgi:ribosomal protein L19E